MAKRRFDERQRKDGASRGTRIASRRGHRIALGCVCAILFPEVYFALIRPQKAILTSNHSSAREVADFKHLHAAEHKIRPCTDFMQTVQAEIVANVQGTDVDVDKFTRDIFKHLRVAEIKKRPSTDYMKTVQTEIDVDIRALLVEWLVETAEQCELVPEVLYLAMNYMDRYLSGNNIKYNRLQLLAATCLLIASKHEEREHVPCVRDLCHLMGNRYWKEDVLQMEANVLECLKFEVTDPTAKSFLRGLVHIA